MIANHDSALYEDKTERTGTSKPLRFVGLKFNLDDISEEVGRDLDFSPEMVKLVIEQFLRRIVYHVAHDQEVTLNYFGRFRLKKGQRHWTLQFIRMRSLSSYLNSRLDNDQNVDGIKKLNPVVSTSWYDHQVLQRDGYRIRKIKPSTKHLDK